MIAILLILALIFSTYSLWVSVILVAISVFMIWKVIADVDKSEKKQLENDKAQVELENSLADSEKWLFQSISMSIQQVISNHVTTLSLKYNQTVIKDEYGILNIDRWVVARKYFINNVLNKNEFISSFIGESVPIDTKMSRIKRIEYLIEESIRSYLSSQKYNDHHLSDYIDKFDPIQFENHCAELLTQNGWDTRVTKASGDQGIDVVATYKNYKVVFQCKKYSKPVGNAAVQEISAGKLHEQADAGAVVSNASYTPSAKQLANSTGIYLLHYSELSQLATRLGLN